MVRLQVVTLRRIRFQEAPVAKCSGWRVSAVCPTRAGGFGPGAHTLRFLKSPPTQNPQPAPGRTRLVAALRGGKRIQVRSLLGYSAASGFTPATDPSVWLF